MDKNEARQYILDRATNWLTPDKTGKGFICPICGSGGGSNGTGITTKDRIHFTCWAGCFSNSDIIDIIAIAHNIPLSDYKAKLEEAAREFNITLDEYQNPPKSGRVKHTQPTIHNNTYTTPQPKGDAAQVDYTQFFLQANKDIEKTTYHRGISLETLNRFLVGYVAEWTHPKDGKHFSPRLIIPTSRESYLARDTRAELPDEAKPYAKSKVGSVHIFNRKGLTTATKPIFIVEGEIDALSIIDAGGEAIALGSITSIKALLEILKNEQPSQPLIIALDNDEAGKRAADTLAQGLDGLKLPFYRLDIVSPYKDANEALNADRAAFIARVEQAENIEAEALEAEKERLQKEAAAYYLDTFIKDIEESKTASYIPTGFNELDKLLDGGLYAGLYIVGAISSLGKTTFCLQIADQVAAAGQDVLIFSLEMARKELIAKSISRQTAIIGKIKEQAKTTRGILTGSRYKAYSPAERELINKALAAYGEYAKHIYINEGLGDINIDYIRDKVKRHLQLTGKAPIVIIDYLQIIAPADVRATDKQNTDKAVLELKRLSRDYNIPVIGISSFNRDNYTDPVNMAAFKESGAIEYSSDILIALQYEGMDYKKTDKGKYEAKDTREKRIKELLEEMAKAASEGKAQKIQIKVLKNRNGSKGSTIIDYYPMFNYFTERGLLLQEFSADEENPFNDEWTDTASTYKK